MRMFGPGLLVAFAVLFSAISLLEVILGDSLRWLPAIIYAVILAPVLLTVVAGARRVRD